MAGHDQRRRDGFEPLPHPLLQREEDLDGLGRLQEHPEVPGELWAKLISLA